MTGLRAGMTGLRAGMTGLRAGMTGLRAGMTGLSAGMMLALRLKNECISPHAIRQNDMIDFPVTSSPAV